MILIESIRDGNAGTFPQLVKGQVSSNSNNFDGCGVQVSTSHLIPATQLTQGQFEVTEILGWDITNETL